MSDEFQFLADHVFDLLIGFPNNRPGGLAMSLLLTIGAILGSLVPASFVGLAHHSSNGAVRFLARRYVGVIRGVPLIVLLLVVHQFTSTGRIFGLETSPVGSAFVTLILYSSAYQADIVAAGVGAIPQMLVDDSRLLGAGRFQLARTVTLPYAARVMRSALVTNAITVFKDSSVVVVLGVADLTTNARIALGGDVTNAPFWVTTYLFVGFLYFATASIAARVLKRIERRGAMNQLAQEPTKVALW